MFKLLSNVSMKEKKTWKNMEEIKSAVYVARSKYPKSQLSAQRTKSKKKYRSHFFLISHSIVPDTDDDLISRTEKKSRSAFRTFA